MLLFKLVELCFVAQRQPDIVEAFNQTELAEGIDFEFRAESAAVRLPK